jgi:hypothetical protein
MCLLFTTMLKCRVSSFTGNAVRQHLYRDSFTFTLMSINQMLQPPLLFISYSPQFHHINATKGLQQLPAQWALINIQTPSTKCHGMLLPPIHQDPGHRCRSGDWISLPCRNSSLKLAVTASVHALPTLVFTLLQPFDALQLMQFLMSKHKPTNNNCPWKKFSVIEL